MNKVLFIFCMSLIIVSHIWAFNYVYEKKVIPISKPKYQKVSLQMARVVEPVVVKKEVKKTIEKKEIFNKPIKKEAKRKLIKKIKKKKPKKKIEKKKIIKKVKKVEKIVKKETIKPIKKVEIKEKIKPVKNISKKNTTQSLEKIKKYKNDYKTALRASINKNKKYPNSSRRVKEQGKVIVGFRVLSTGVFQNMRIIKSSGKKRLDKAALKALLKTAKFKPFGKELNQSYLDLKLPILFRLK